MEGYAMNEIDIDNYIETKYINPKEYRDLKEEDDETN